MKVWIWFVVALSAVATGVVQAPASPADADHPTSVTQQLVIENATELESRLAQEAFPKVVDYYRLLGFPIPPDSHPRIVFQDQIEVDGRIMDHAHGVFDPSTATIYMIHFDSQQFQNCGSLGIGGCEELYFTVLVHEMAHFANSLVSPGLVTTIDELIACTVQLSLMDVELRDRILNSTEVKRFRNVHEIRIIKYRSHPDNFILASYCFSVDKPEMFVRFLKQTNPPLRDPLFFD
jgi:hypothetical protein